MVQELSEVRVVRLCDYLISGRSAPCSKAAHLDGGQIDFLGKQLEFKKLGKLQIA